LSKSNFLQNIRFSKAKNRIEQFLGVKNGGNSPFLSAFVILEHQRTKYFAINKKKMGA
jgi:hypothetical protein